MLREIIFDRVRYCYGEVCAVNNVSFSIKEKTLTAFIGPNGAGKSTFLKLIAGLIKPEEGSIYFGKGASVGYMSQSVGFEVSFPITIKELVLTGTLCKDIKPFYRYSELQKQKAIQSIERVGLLGLEDRGINQLSGGQLKRAIIARAVASDSDIIVLDEPDKSLDIDAIVQLYSILGELKKDKTIIIASHNVDVILDNVDSAIYVNKTAVEYPDPQELKEKLKEGIVI